MLLNGQMERFDSNTVFELYVSVLIRRSAPLAAAFLLLTDPSNLPLLVHCAFRNAGLNPEIGRRLFESPAAAMTSMLR